MHFKRQKAFWIRAFLKVSLRILSDIVSSSQKNMKHSNKQKLGNIVDLII